MKLNCARIALVILMAAIAAQAATITTYSTQSGFSNAATGITLLDFASTALGDYSFPTGLTAGGINIVGYDAAGFSLGVKDVTFNSHFIWGTHVLVGGNASPTTSYIQFNLAGVKAAALHLGTYWEGNPVTVTLATGESFTVTTPTSQPGAFWGFTSDTAENYIRVSTPSGGSPVVIDLQYGDAGAPADPPADTPEAMTMLTLGAGLLALAGLKRLRPADGLARA